jgi:hypothetical protein
MKKSAGTLALILVLALVLLSACGAAPKEALATASLVGTIESMDRTQWVVSGQMVGVEAKVLAGRAFQVGDTVQIDVVLLTDGSYSAKRIVRPTQLKLAGNDNGN